jgi:N-acetylglucosaminyldiphosphoundecaprenol N-acetyl-beta-D-mannosaminyltransferase
MSSSLPPLKIRRLLGTSLLETTYGELSEFLFAKSAEPGTCAVDFTNTHIVSMRRHDQQFRKVTDCMDYFVPDGMPLIWCLNATGAGLKDRVYGPTFFRECLKASPAHIRHFFLGGDDDCLSKLLMNVRKLNPALAIAGSRNGYFSQSLEGDIFEEIQRSNPDFIWIGMGTPRQQEWISRWKEKFPRGILLAVGFAFDVNAGTKRDAPGWMQKLGLTWMFRMLSEPRRLVTRYAKHNGLFLFYLAKAALSGNIRN